MVEEHLSKSRPFCFSPDQSGRQVFLWPSHHHGEHAGRQPVIAALSGVGEGGRLLHLAFVDTCPVHFQQQGLIFIFSLAG